MSIVKKLFDLVDEVVTLGGLIDNEYVAYGLTGVDPISVYLHTHYVNPDLSMSPTYSSNIIGDTVSEGMYISRCYGQCEIGGNALRYNDPDDNDLRIILGHCQGPINSFVSYEVNDIAWGSLTGAHTKTEYTGTRTQTADARFAVDASAYRGIAYTALTFVKNDQQIGYNPNITTIIEGLLCAPLAGGADAFTRNPAVIMYDWLINVEGYSAGDIDLNSFKSLEALCDAVPAGGTLPRYRFDYNFDTPAAMVEGKKLIWQSFNGCTIKSQGKIKAVWDSGQMADGAGGLTAKVTALEAIGNLVLCLSMDDGSGTTATDSSGNSHDATLINTPSWVTGKSGYAIDLEESSSQYGTISHHADINFERTDAFSISAYVKRESSKYNTIFSKQDINSVGYYLLISPITNYVYFGLVHELNVNWIVARTETTTIESGEWYHIAVTYDGSSALSGVKFYINKVLQVTEGIDALSDSIQNTTDACIGKHASASSYFDGILDDVRIYNKELSLSEINIIARIQNFNEDNIVKGTFKRNQPQKYNLVRVVYKDSAKKYDTSSVYVSDDQSIEENGEITFEETCFYITDAELARRRAQFLFNKFKYTDYECTFTAFTNAGRVELYDLITISHSKAGWTSKPFIVTGYSENEEGQPTIKASAYHVGMYDDAAVEEQLNYASDLPNPFVPPKVNTAVSASLISPGTGFDYDSVKVSITKPVNEAFYSYTEVYISNVAGGAGTYYLAGTTSGEDIVIQGMGMFYVPGDTIYVKTVNYNERGIPSSMPGSPEASVVITSAIRFGSFYIGVYDFWGGNAAIGNAATTIVIGNLDGTPKIALGASADSLTIANMATYPGLFADGGGNVRAGNAGGGFVSTAGTFTVSGDIVIAGGDAVAGNKIEFEGTFMSQILWSDELGVNLYIYPDTDNSAVLNIGTSSKRYNGILSYAFGQTNWAYYNANSNAYTWISASSGTEAFADIGAKHGGTQISVRLYNDNSSFYFAPVTGTVDLGTATYLWNNLYVTEINLSSTGKVISGVTTLTDNVDTDLFEVAVASGEMVGGHVFYSINVSGGGEYQCFAGKFSFCAVNKAGTVTNSIDLSDTLASEITGGTTSTAFTITDGTGKITVSLTQDTNLGTPTLTINYMVILNTDNILTKL